MRLSGPGTKHPMGKRLIHWIIRRQTKAEVPDVVLTLHHRPRFFGTPFSRWLESSMRGPSDWTQGDREVMAALVSSWNQCLF
jgi:hypothetical protein